MIDFTASQAQPSAQRARPLRQAVLVDPHQGCCVMRHDRHPGLDDRTAMAFVAETPGSTTQQTGHEAFDHRSAVPTGVGAVHLGRGAYVVQVRFVQDPKDVLRGRRQGEGSDGFRDAYGENPPRMQCLPQGGVIERQIARQRVDGQGGARPDPGDGRLHMGNQGLHISDITGMAHRQREGNDEASGWIGDHARLAAKRGGAVACAFAHGSNGGIVGVDNLAVGQRFALRQASRLVCDPVMRLKRGRELGVQLRPRLCRPLRRGPCRHAWAARANGSTGRPTSSNGVSVWRTSVTNTWLISRHWRPKRRIIFARSRWSCCAGACSAVPLVAHSSVMVVTPWRTFWGPYTAWPHH